MKEVQLVARGELGVDPEEVKCQWHLERGGDSQFVGSEAKGNSQD